METGCENGLSTVRYGWKVTPLYPSAKYHVDWGAGWPGLKSESSAWFLALVRVIVRSA